MRLGVLGFRFQGLGFMKVSAFGIENLGFGAV